MTDVTELRCWPSCVDAIDWSQDGIIALASDERVELLFPNTISFDRDQDAATWQHVPLKAPLFSYEELPVKEPAPLTTYSIGEEVSNSAPIAIAWSPPGLAKHRRCALATLTANLVLSIWSTEGKPQEESSWSRRLIVNNALAEYFNDAAGEPSHLVSDSREQIRLRARIRAFAWAPALPNSEANNILGTRLSYGQHIIAVSNDDNQVAFVVVDSPTSTLGVDQSWRAEVLAHCSLTPDSESIFTQPIFFEEMMKQQRYISHLAWSPWIIRGEWNHSVIVYATNEDVRARIITYAHDSIGLGEEVVYPDLVLRCKGPMKWAPRVEDGNKFKLALFTNSGLVYLTISADDASIIDQATHDLDGRWDQISGAVWDSAEQSTLRLHFSSIQSTLHNPTAALEASADGLKTLISPSWRDQIENNLVLFSVKNDLKGNSKAKVWGLTISPLGDFIVACNSVHPSDMIEYGPPADRRGTVAISILRQYRQLRKAFPVQDVSAEGILFTIKKLAENTVEDTDQMPMFAEEIVEKLMQAYSSPQVSRGSNSISARYPDSSNLNALIAMFKKAAFLDPNTLRDRYTILVSEACNATSSNSLLKTLIAYRLAASLQDLPSSLTQTSFSADILAQHRQLMKLINALTEPEPETLDAKPSSSETNDDTNSESPTYPSEHTNDTTAHIHLPTANTDTCDFCTAPIPFTDLTSASCTNGHVFPRCGLSFLPIQAPGITKYCGLCSTPFLGEEFVMAQEEVVGNRTESSNNAVKKAASAGIADAQEVVRDDEGGEGRKLQETMGAVNSVDEVDEGTVVSIAEKAEQQPRTHEEHNVNGGEEVLEQGGLAQNAPIPDEAEQRDLPVTLARVLFLACDACIYCGGKFVG